MSLADQVRGALARDADAELSSGDDPGLAARPAAELVPAAVLVALTDRPRPGIVLTQRTETLRAHAGQVAFPGGRVDPGEDAVAAALREAEEEIALPPAAVEVVGALARYRTGTGFEITPVLGVVPPDLPLVPAEAEVAAVFEVPIAYLFDTANHHEGRAMWQGSERRFVEIPWGERRIWGATAAMIVNLSRVLRWL